MILILVCVLLLPWSTLFCFDNEHKRAEDIIFKFTGKRPRRISITSVINGPNNSRLEERYSVFTDDLEKIAASAKSAPPKLTIEDSRSDHSQQISIIEKIHDQK